MPLMITSEQLLASCRYLPNLLKLQLERRGSYQLLCFLSLHDVPLCASLQITAREDVLMILVTS